MLGICAWCQKQGEVETDHIVPKDVLRAFGPGRWDDEDNKWSLCVRHHCDKTEKIDGPLITKSWFIRRHSVCSLEGSQLASILLWGGSKRSVILFEMYCWSARFREYADSQNQAYEKIEREARKPRLNSTHSPVAVGIPYCKIARALNNFGYHEAAKRLIPPGALKEVIKLLEGGVEPYKAWSIAIPCASLRCEWFMADQREEETFFSAKEEAVREAQRKYSPIQQIVVN